MTWRTEIPYDDLPQTIKRGIPKEHVWWASANGDASTLVLWAGPGSRHELEFSPKLDRFLSRGEREEALPPRHEFSISNHSVRVVQSSVLLPENDIRYESYVVYGNDRNVVTECGQNYFGPVFQDPEVMVENALRESSFPERYGGWSRSERIRHWVTWLHRGRRWAGEDGHDEAAAFTPAAWQYMLSTDPEVDQILPDIIGDLARMWMIDADEMLADFRHRVSRPPNDR